MKRFNDWLGNKLANGLSTMLFFYLCGLIDLVELPPVIKAHDVITWCSYVSQTVIQLLALPLLAYQNKAQQQSHDDLHGKVDKLHQHLGIPHDPSQKN